MSRQNSLLPASVTEDQLRNSIDVVPGLTVTAETPTASSQKIDGASLGALVEEKTQPKTVIKISHSHINIKVRYIHIQFNTSFESKVQFKPRFRYLYFINFELLLSKFITFHIFRFLTLF